MITRVSIVIVACKPFCAREYFPGLIFWSKGSFKSFTDSSLIDFNNAFIVGAYNTEFDFYKFYSANNGQSTVSNLSVYFKHFVNDTLTIDTLNTHNIIDENVIFLIMYC